jgi:hypothetical protein
VCGLAPRGSQSVHFRGHTVLLRQAGTLSGKTMFCQVDDKYVPLYRVLWVSATPHFCGAPDCQQEGDYEIRLEQGESVWGTREERDAMLRALEEWQGGAEPSDEDWE